MSDLTPPPLIVGLTHTAQLVVEPRHTVPGVSPDWPAFADMPPVLATAMMVAFMEKTCVDALRPYLTPGQRTVGTHIDVSHCAATPVGMRVTAQVELIEVDGRALKFRVRCHDEVDLIGEGLHRRAIIGFDKFLTRTQAKLVRRGTP